MTDPASILLCLPEGSAPFDPDPAITEQRDVTLVHAWDDVQRWCTPLYPGAGTPKTREITPGRSLLDFRWVLGPRAAPRRHVGCELDGPGALRLPTGRAAARTHLPMVLYLGIDLEDRSFEIVQLEAGGEYWMARFTICVNK